MLYAVDLPQSTIHKSKFKVFIFRYEVFFNFCINTTTGNYAIWSELFMPILSMWYKKL